MDRYTRKSFILEIVVIFATAVMLMPFWILLVGSFKSLPEVLSSSAIAPPRHPTLENFRALLSPESAQAGNIFSGLASSVAITAGSVVLLVALGSLAGYAITRSTARWSRRVYAIFLVAIVLPTQLGTLPLYIEARRLSLAGTPWGMALIYAGMLMPLAVFIYGNFFRSLSQEYEEAALLDGATRMQVFTRIVFPLMAPANGTVAILTGLIVWNDFFTSLIFLGGTRYQTLPVVLYTYVGSLVSKWNLIFAVVIVSMLPMLAIYTIIQRKLMHGYTGGLKS